MIFLKYHNTDKVYGTETENISKAKTKFLMVYNKHKSERKYLKKYNNKKNILFYQDF